MLSCLWFLCYKPIVKLMQCNGLAVGNRKALSNSFLLAANNLVSYTLSSPSVFLIPSSAIRIQHTVAMYFFLQVVM